MYVSHPQRLSLHAAKAQPAQPTADGIQGQALPCPHTDWYANYGGFQSRYERVSPENGPAVLNVSDGITGLFDALLPHWNWNKQNAVARRNAYLGIRSNATGAKGSDTQVDGELSSTGVCNTAII
jgi:hypothetical protein